jgi:hypothetical protein
MKIFEPAQAAGQAAQPYANASGGLNWVRGGLRLRTVDVQIYLVCERLAEWVIYLMVLFSPWAFGTSEPWSIRVMNTAGYVLGAMLAVKLAIRRLKGYRPARWDGPSLGSRVLSPESEVHGPQSRVHSPQSTVHSPRSEGRRHRSVVRGPWSVVRSLFTASGLTAALAWLTVAILGYCLVSALNARATYQPETNSLAYRRFFIPWLPHSLDCSRTWFVFWSYLGLACSFWAVRDWLLGKSFAEAIHGHQRSGPGSRGEAGPFPARLRRLFWVLAINGALLGIEGIIQRLEGSGKLLFLVRPHIHKTAETQFGPYAYYANAAQYFNLLWPGCLGFWWMLHRSRGARQNAPAASFRLRLRGRRRERTPSSPATRHPSLVTHHLILVCCAIMAACPIISTSRGGALVAVAMLVLAALFFAATHFLLGGHENRRTGRITFTALCLFFAGALALGFALGWKALEPRLAQLREGYINRELDYERARPMAAEYPLFGTGPGTFESVSQLYRPSTEVNWFEELHNDWLETRITFGWVGSVLIALAFTTVVLRWFVPGGIYGGRRFVMLMWLALGGCMVHARFDFPFQMHSILFLFLVLCAILFILSRRPAH